VSRARVDDEHLRIRALEALGALGDALAREALETGVVSVEHDVIAWEGTQGTMHGHRIVVTLDAPIHARVTASHAARDGLAAALAAAMAERGGQAVADVRLEVGVPRGPSSSPYRGRP
jgi:hypothetical protein